MNNSYYKFWNISKKFLNIKKIMKLKNISDGAYLAIIYSTICNHKSNKYFEYSMTN